MIDTYCAGFIDLNTERDTRNNNDAACIVVVLVIEPQNAAEDLENIERVENLQKDHNQSTIFKSLAFTYLGE
jgi:hypothetical protein